MENKNELGRWVEREMKKRKWSQHKLAKEAGISQAQVSRIINFKPKDNLARICGAEVAGALASALGVNETYVFRLARILSPPRRSRNFSTWLIGELLLRNISQEELAKQSGVGLETIAELVQGIPPSISILTKISPPLNRNVEELTDIAGLYTEDMLETFEPSREEINMLEKYRKLSARDRKIINDIIMLHLKSNS